MDLNAAIIQPLPSSSGSTKGNYLQLLTDYHDLAQMNRQLERDRVMPMIKGVSRPQTQYQFSTNTDDELRNVYKQVEILNNIIMDKDF